jgi:cohesin complex subunit SA-1/2
LYAERYGASDGTTASTSKRKRAGGDEEDAEDEENASKPEGGESSDEEPDEEELRAKKRAARKASTKKTTSDTKGKTKSRSAKKPKVAGNGIGSQLAFRPATNGKKTLSRPRKPTVRPSLAAGEKGLYGTFPFLLLSWLCCR